MVALRVDVASAGRTGDDAAREAKSLEDQQRAFDRHDMVKRAFDIVVGSLLLMLSLPVILVTAIGSAVALGAWPFFVQDRIGRSGERFRFVKVRTLPPTTNAYADKYSIADVRIPAFTKGLRMLHLDELPQLALVVIGQMSLVGPRPEMPELHAQLSRHAATSRSLVRPGCTGFWQVGMHCDGLIAEAPEYDAYYVQHHNLRLDVWIMLQTVLKMARGGRGTVALTDVPAWVCEPVVVTNVLDLDRAAENVVIDLSSGVLPGRRALQQSRPEPLNQAISA
jgi:lipopolysaccharide/colanic/teichoic acid biosynthesis glycosyltransferase